MLGVSNQFGNPFGDNSPVQQMGNVGPIPFKLEGNKPKIETPPEASYPRGLNYYADYSGCGHWRMIWPEFIMNMNQAAVIHGTTCMVLDPRYYAGVKSVRVQRQASENQLQFAKFLKLPLLIPKLESVDKKSWQCVMRLL